jgi:hypothetical protein
MARNYNTAWLSIKDTLLHIIWAEDSWINYSINDLDDQIDHLILQNIILGKR